MSAPEEILWILVRDCPEFCRDSCGYRNRNMLTSLCLIQLNLVPIQATNRQDGCIGDSQSRIQHHLDESMSSLVDGHFQDARNFISENGSVGVCFNFGKSNSSAAFCFIHFLRKANFKTDRSLSTFFDADSG